MKDKKKTQTTPETILHGMEMELSLLIEKLVKDCLLAIKKLFLKNTKSSKKITPECLTNKEQWYDKNAFAFSLVNKMEVYMEQFDLDRNTFVCATTGAGKNVCIDEIIENRIKNGHTVIYISPKGDKKDIDNFKSINRKYNSTARVFGSIDTGSVSYNPLECGDATRITERVFNSFTWSEQYYASCNYVAIQGAVRNILNDSARGVVTIGGLLREIIENFNSKETQDIITKLSKLNLSQVGEFLEPTEDLKSVSIESLKASNESLIFSLSTLGMPTVSKQIGKMLVYDLMNHAFELYRRGVDSSDCKLKRVTLVIDEFGSIATPDIINLINKGRGSGIGLCTSTQTLADIDHLGESFRNQFIGNCQNFFIGKSINPTEADYWAKFLGTNSVEKMTVQTENGEEGVMGTVREVNEYKIDPNTIRDLNVGQFVLCSYMPNWSLDVVKVHLKTRDQSFGIIPRTLEPNQIISHSNDKKRKALGSIHGASIENFRKEIKDNKAIGEMGNSRLN